MIRIRRNIFTHDYEVIGINGDTENTESIEVTENSDSETISEDKITDFINNYYSYINKEYYDIVNNKSLEINIKSGSIKNFEKLIIKHDKYANMFESRDLTIYDMLKKYLRPFKKNLSKYLKKKYNISPPSYSPVPIVSQAWLKMYEMLEIFDLFNSNKQNLRTFHGCEAPGSFILAIEHYIKTKTEIKNWEWVGQSLKPGTYVGEDTFHKKSVESFGDDYLLMQNNPDKWDFGKVNGDITNKEEIKYYKDKYTDIDLMTFDCGIAWSIKCDSIKLIYAQMLFILRVLTEGGNGLFKIKIDLLKEPIILSTIIYLTTKFENVYLYKPNQNTWSTEFYIICIDYKHNVSEEDYEQLSGLLDNFDKDKEVIDMENLDVDIINNMLYGINQIIEQHIYDMKRSFYYIDYFTENDDEDQLKDMIRKNQKKLKVWAKEFKIKSL